METQVWADVRRLKEVEGLSEREISRRLTISRGKVRRALAGLPSQSLSGVRVFEKLKAAGYTGGLTTVRNNLMKARGQNREAFVRYETAPGEEAQVDWGYWGLFPFEQWRRKVYFFVMVLGYSRKLFVEFTTSQSLADFLQCHVKAFKYFGGVTKNIRYDNLKSVVISRYLKHIQFNRKFLEFAGYYLFVPQVCNIAKGNEKGKVESGVGYVKKNFLAGREFNNFADLERQLQAWLIQVNQRRHGTTGEAPEERFLREKEFLLPLQPKSYDTTLPVPAKAYHDCFVRFENNYYSVPAKYILLPLTLRIGKYQVKIFYQETLVATHQRGYGQGQRIEDPSHFQELLKIKKAAYDSKLRDRFLSLAPCCHRYFDGLIRLEKDFKAELRQIMRQVDVYGPYEVIPAIEKALTHQAFGAIYVKNIIAQNRAGRHEKTITPLKLEHYPELNEVEIVAQDLAGYDKLFDDPDNAEKEEADHV